MITEHEKEEEETPEDPIESLLVKVKENAGALDTVMKIIDRLQRGGFAGIVEKIADGALPSDLEYLFEFFTSEPMRDSILKGGNLVLLLMHAATEEKTADAIKGIASNLSYIVDSAGSFADGNGKPNVLKLYSAIRDPDVNYALLTMMGALKAVGRIMKDMKEENKDMESLLK